MTIVTQENELINYDCIKKIVVFEGEFENESEYGEGAVKAYAIMAFDINSSFDDELGETDGATQLGVYGSESECEQTIEKLLIAIRQENPVFTMPQPSEGLSA